MLIVGIGTRRLVKKKRKLVDDLSWLSSTSGVGWGERLAWKELSIFLAKALHFDPDAKS